VSFDASFVHDGEKGTGNVTGEIRYKAPPPSGVLANDSDAEDNHLTSILVSAPAHGSLSLNSNGTFAYQPNPDFTGLDSFTYKANDATADSNVATVSLNVTQVPSFMELATSSAFGTYGTPITFTATVTATATPTGKVEVFDDTSGADLGAGILQSTDASTAVWAYTTTPNQLQVTGGAHAIRAVYTSLGGLIGCSASITGGETVTPKNLTATGILVADKTYDATTGASLDTSKAELVGVVSGDVITLNTEGAAGAFAIKAVGTGIPVTITGLSINGPGAKDYVFTQPTTTGNITPSLVIHPLSAMRGNPVVITSALLSADAVDAPNIVVYTLVSSPTSGTLTNGGAILSPGSTFTQADINANKVRYLSATGSPDVFEFTVTDGQGGTVPTTMFPVSPPKISSVSMLEGTSGLTAFNFRVTLPAAATKAVTFDFFTTDGTAVSTGAQPNFVAILPGVNAPHAVGTVSFAAGQVAQTLTVYVIAGSIPVSAGTKTFTVSLSSPAAPTAAMATATGTIIPQSSGSSGGNGGALPKPSINDVSALEGQSGLTAFNFHVNLSAAPSKSVTYDAYTTDGTARTGGNFVGILAGINGISSLGTITFAAGQVSGTITVYVIGGSLPVSAGAKTFTVSMSDPAHPDDPLATAAGTIIPQSSDRGALIRIRALDEIFAEIGSGKDLLGKPL
jgi:VCBS repeat-containing protein